RRLSLETRSDGLPGDFPFTGLYGRVGRKPALEIGSALTSVSLGEGGTVGFLSRSRLPDFRASGLDRRRLCASFRFPVTKGFAERPTPHRNSLDRMGRTAYAERRPLAPAPVCAYLKRVFTQGRAGGPAPRPERIIGFTCN